MNFTKYADDAIIHCNSKQHAEKVLKQVETRMNACDLELHPQKTKIVYCKDYRRKENYKNVKFDFLGFSFQPRTTKSKKTGKLFVGFDCAISISSHKQIADKQGEMKIEKMCSKSIVGIAYMLNPIIRGYELSKVFRVLRIRTVSWARKRYKRYRNNLNKACNWFDSIESNFRTSFTIGN